MSYLSGLVIIPKLCCTLHIHGFVVCTRLTLLPVLSAALHLEYLADSASLFPFLSSARFFLLANSCIMRDFVS